MSTGKHPPGYTVIEVMLVLAVSGFIFTIAATFVNGRQAKVAFTEGSNLMAAQIQDVINEVIDGEYSDTPLECSYSSGSTHPNIASSATDTQGKNAECVFLGKMFHFNNNADSEDTRYDILSLAAGRATPDDSDRPLTDLVESDPKVITGLTTRHLVPQNLDINKITVNDTFDSYVFGFLQGQGSLDSGDSLDNGAQGVNLYFIEGAGPALTVDQAIIRINSPVFLEKANKVEICLSDGERYSVVNIGVTNGQMTATTKIWGTTKPGVCV